MKKIQAKLLRAQKLTNDVCWFDFVCDSGDFEFKAGQFLILNVADGKEPPASRAYSISSRSGRDGGGFSLCVKLIPGGRGSEFLGALQPGDKVEFQGPNGHFVLDESYTASGKKLIFVATGVGLSPFLGMLEHIFATGLQREIHLIFGTRYEEDLFYTEQFAQWKNEHPNFDFVVTLSKPTENWTGQTGYVTDHLDALQPGNSEVYICGNGQMVKDVRGIALERGFSKENIHFELFTPIVLSAPSSTAK